MGCYTQLLISPISQLICDILHHLLCPLLKLLLTSLELVPDAYLDVLSLQWQKWNEYIHQTLLNHPAVLQTSGLIKSPVSHQRLQVF